MGLMPIELRFGGLLTICGRDITDGRRNHFPLF
jgi:hypothetical protein